MNKNITNIVNLGDRVCATLACNGRCLASVNGSDFASLEAVKRATIWAWQCSPYAIAPRDGVM